MRLSGLYAPKSTQTMLTAPSESTTSVVGFATAKASVPSTSNSGLLSRVSSSTSRRTSRGSVLGTARGGVLTDVWVSCPAFMNRSYFGQCKEVKQKILDL